MKGYLLRKWCSISPCQTLLFLLFPVPFPFIFFFPSPSPPPRAFSSSSSSSSPFLLFCLNCCYSFASASSSPSSFSGVRGLQLQPPARPLPKSALSAWSFPAWEVACFTQVLHRSLLNRGYDHSRPRKWQTLKTIAASLPLPLPALSLSLSVSLSLSLSHTHTHFVTQPAKMDDQCARMLEAT